MDKADELSTKELNFKIWKEYQKIEMHFNDLLIKLRVQILGLVVAVITIGGFVLKLTNTGAIDWKIVFWILIVLCFIWIALFYDWKVILYTHPTKTTRTAKTIM